MVTQHESSLLTWMKRESRHTQPIVNHTPSRTTVAVRNDNPLLPFWCSSHSLQPEHSIHPPDDLHPNLVALRLEEQVVQEAVVQPYVLVP
jgi:hypothetical protein